MSVPADSWVVQQRRVFELRRRFIRDVLLRGLAFRLLVQVTVEGLEHVPASGPAILMINHITAIDPIVALGAIPHRFIVPMSKVENWWHPLIGVLVRSWGAYAVRRGKVDRTALQTTVDLLKVGELVLIAPEGTRQPALIRPKHGLTYVALRAPAALIVPTAVYNTEGWLRDLFIPWQRTAVHVAFGRPFRLRTGGRVRVPRDEMRRMTDEMMYQLAALLPARNRGQYADLAQMTTDYLEFASL